ncbi:MAG: altronate dehydratase [Lachnospiraceae bacterium]|nr:altronate dehydratase [Lachnospiraceae bacterium]
MGLIRIHPSDNVAVDTATGHKQALALIPCGSDVVKYGFPIGHATADIKAGEHVHTHNMATNLGELLTYEYAPDAGVAGSDMARNGVAGTTAGIEAESGKAETSAEYTSAQSTTHTIMAYVRPNGDIGIRNDIWIINTVGCVNKLAETLARRTGAFSFAHPYGCSQLGGDHETTQKILRGLVKHPNAGGVLVLGLGCENNNIEEFRKVLGPVDEERVRFLNAQTCEDELEEGVRIIEELKAIAAKDVRVSVPVSRLKIGLKCGGSDGFSGITANPLIGRLSDWLCAQGGSTVLTEVPEMFGAETILMNRCVNRKVFDKTVGLINGFKEYFTRHGQVIYENPSPGNKAGGITTLEEKSLGCTQKGGTSPVVDVLDYGDTVTKAGLNLLNGPGNDMVAVTNLTAAGCHMILFSTGRGTPLGAPVPTVKIGTNREISERKKNWIDFDAGPMIDGADLAEEFIAYCLQVAEGRETNNERNGYREIAIFKDGVTL